MRKMSAYARKLRRTGGTFNGAEFLNVIQRSRPYTDEPIPGSWLPGTKHTAEVVALRVRAALDNLLAHQLPPEDTESHDLLAHAYGVATIRALEIGPNDPELNPALAYLRTGSQALASVGERRRRLGRWGVAGSERQALIDAVDVYEEILAASSPAQMEHATAQRQKLLEERA